MSGDHELQTLVIRKAILAEESRLRAKLPFLKYQTEIGFTLWLGSILWILTNAWLFLNGYQPWYTAIPSAAFPLSILHELEHDLIHKQYFHSSKRVQDILLSFIWILKSGQELSPFVRRDLHLHHHQRSGQIDDVEERLIGLGIKSNLFRLTTAFFPGIGLLYVIAPGWGLEATTNWRLFQGSKLYTVIDFLLINTPLVLASLAYMGYTWAWILFVVWAAPNVLRHACLSLLSSYSHYYLADDEGSVGDVTLQNQVLNHWSLYPLQFFCFNFGAEHIIHHYVVGQAFYMRHMCRAEAWKVMKENGVRINDFGTITRANRRDKIEGKMA